MITQSQPRFMGNLGIATKVFQIADVMEVITKDFGNLGSSIEIFQVAQPRFQVDERYFKA